MDKPSSEHCSKLFRYLLLAGVAEIIQYLQGSNHGSAIPLEGLAGSCLWLTAHSNLRIGSD